MTRTELLEHYLKPTDLTVEELIDRSAFTQIMQFAEAYRFKQLRIPDVVGQSEHFICGAEFDGFAPCKKQCEECAITYIK